jgi:RluA family pseudouridine synthase
MAQKLLILFEDADLLVVNKPPGLITSSTPREKRPTLLKLVQQYLRDTSPRSRIGLIHRLDRDAQGLIVFSKNARAFASLKRQLFHRTIERVYLAVVEGVPRPARGRIESRLLELPDGRVVRTTHRARGEVAVSEFETLQTNGNRSLLQVKLHTGRKHQIRSQLAEMKHPVVNDAIYHPNPGKGILMLCAVRLSFAHPRTGKPVKFEINPPTDMTRLFRGDNPAR